jgi:SAM-dependent methyltransferase
MTLASLSPLPSSLEALLAGWPRATPLDAVGQLVEERVLLGEHAFAMLRPAEPDLLLEHPAILTAFAADEYMPYWCDLWPASRMLAKAILHYEWPTGLRALEVGCGLGMAGIAALRRGLAVTFSDYDATALRFAAANALRNGHDQFELLPLNWHQPPQRTFNLILGADLLYETRAIDPVVALLQQMLAPQGVAWITDQDRTPAPLWRDALTQHGFQYNMLPLHAGQPAGPGQTARRVKGTLYQIRRTKT